MEGSETEEKGGKGREGMRSKGKWYIIICGI